MKKSKAERDIAKEINLKLKAPMIALERLAEGRSLPVIFAKAGLEELETIQELLSRFENPEKRRG
ncbi:MAG: hypothetical protein H6754_06845 [Candidatus Omnitrophica bacterium]|nr:hypothetical protein [Candidatus Omnitrophota bacterium]